MTKTKFVIAALPVLLTSTGVMAADLGTGTETVSGPGYTLSASMGVIAFGLPASDTGVLATGAFTTTDPDVNPVGLDGSLSGQFDVGTTGGAKLSIGVDVFGAVAGGSHSTTETFTGPGTIQIDGYTIPTGIGSSLATSTGPGGSATAQVSGPAAVSQTATASGGLGAQDAIGVKQPDPNEFSLAVASVNAAGNGSAYNGIASTSGGFFTGIGDLTGLKVTTTNSSQIFYGGADINLAATGNISTDTTLQASVGPSYKYLGQHNVSSTTAYIPAATASLGTAVPTYNDTRTEDLNSNYLGGLVGVTLGHKVTDSVSVALGGEFGLYDMWANYTGSESYTISGGACPPGCTAGTLPITSQTVTNSNHPSGSANGTAYSAGINGSATTALSDKLSVTFAASGEYLSSVPVLSHPAGGGTPTLGFGSMWDATGSIALNGSF